MKYLLSILCLFVLSCSSVPEHPPSEEQMNNIKSDVAKLNDCDDPVDGCRWTDVEIGYGEFEKTKGGMVLDTFNAIYISVENHPDANTIAKKSYQKKLGDIVKEYAAQYNYAIIFTIDGHRREIAWVKR